MFFLTRHARSHALSVDARTRVSPARAARGHRKRSHNTHEHAAGAAQGRVSQESKLHNNTSKAKGEGEKPPRKVFARRNPPTRHATPRTSHGSVSQARPGAAVNPHHTPNPPARCPHKRAGVREDDQP